MLKLLVYFTRLPLCEEKRFIFLFDKETLYVA